MTHDCELTRFNTILWYEILKDHLGESLVKDKKDDEKSIPMVFCDPMDRADAFLFHSVGMADTVIQIHRYEHGNFITFQPAIPQPVTDYVTKPPVKTRPLNSDHDMRTLSDAVAYFAGKEFLKWQGTAVLESQKIVAWRGESAAFLESLAKEPWCPTVAMSDDGSVKACVGRVVVNVKPGKLTISFSGPASEYLDVIRGALRDEHRFREERRAERDAEN